VYLIQTWFLQAEDSLVPMSEVWSYTDDEELME
jgi:hypothetical protein